VAYQRVADHFFMDVDWLQGWFYKVDLFGGREWRAPKQLGSYPCNLVILSCSCFLANLLGAIHLSAGPEHGGKFKSYEWQSQRGR